MFQAIILWLEQTAQSVPLPVFVVMGGVVEEMVAPIPSPLVAVMAGSIASAQQLGIPYLLWICFLASVAKTFGAWLFYVLGDKLEDVAIPRFGRYIGVQHEDLEHFGERFQGTKKDDVILILLRSIPVMPSTPVSLVCGILKINLRTFVVSTLCGFFIRNLTFMLIGYTGLSAVDALMQGIATAETVLKLAMVLGGILLLGWLYGKRRTGHPAQWFRFTAHQKRKHPQGRAEISP